MSTNQEILQQNNDRIEAIQQTLANKVVTSGEIEIVENGKHDVSKYASANVNVPQPSGTIEINENGTHNVKDFENANVNVQPSLIEKEITANGTYNASDDQVDGYSSVEVAIETGSRKVVVDLPEDFATATNVYDFQVNDNTILISADVQGIGIWEYDIASKELVKVYDKYDTWKYFQIFGNVCLISGVSIDSGYCGVVGYNITDKTFTPLYSVGDGWNVFTPIGTKCLIGSNVTGTSGASGVLLYDSDKGTVKNILSDTYAFAYFYVIDDRCLISSVSRSGIYRYKLEDDTIEKVYDGGLTSFNAYARNETKCLIGSNRSGNLVLYNIEEDTADSAGSVSSSAQKHFFAVGEDFLIGLDSTSTGLYLYNGADGTLSKIYSPNCYTNGKVIGDYCVLSGKSSSGVLVLYNSTDKSIQTVSAGYNYTKFEMAGQDCVISGASISANGIWLYNGTEHTLKEAYSKGYWPYVYPVGENCLFCSNTSAYPGLLFYDNETKTVTRKFSGGYSYNIIEQDGENCYLSSTLASNKRKLYYNNADKTIKMVGLDLGEL